MTDVLGYRRFGAQGGDWGAFITARLAVDVPDRLAGIHLNLMTLRRDPARLDHPTEDEARYQEQLATGSARRRATRRIQGTKPQTLAYGLTDSPVGLAAWIVEKFRTWSDCGGDVERRFSKDELLTNITIYWVTGAIGSSFWPYYARIHERVALAGRRPHRGAHGLRRVPARDPHPAAGLGRARIRHPALDGDAGGGHFAALEEPEALAGEIRAFFRDLRSP